jgi:hypothetical protein
LDRIGAINSAVSRALIEKKASRPNGPGRSNAGQTRRKSATVSGAMAPIYVCDSQDRPFGYARSRSGSKRRHVEKAGRSGTWIPTLRFIATLVPLRLSARFCVYKGRSYLAL